MNKRLLILLTLIYGNYVQGTEDDKALDDSNIIVFLNVNVVPMDKERVIPEQTVVVENGMITGIASVSDVTISKAATRIDGTGKYLIPGIAEMHGHLPGPGYSREATENTLFLYVANGVTLLRGMQGHPQQLELKRKIQRGELIGPRLLVSSPPLSGRNTKSPEMAESKVREAKSKGLSHVNYFVRFDDNYDGRLSG